MTRHYLIILLFALLSCSEDPTSDNSGGADGGTPPTIEVSAEAWVAFDEGKGSNVLLDYSYAGYKRGEEAVPNVSTLGYTTYDITNYGAIAGDDQSDLAAITAAVTAAKQQISWGNINGAIIYIPEGVFDIHTENDAQEATIFTTGNIVLKGAGRDLSTLRMSSEMQPEDESILYSSPVAIWFKHQSDGEWITNVSSDSSKGGTTLWLDSTAGLSAGDWVCLRLTETSAEFLEERLGSDYYQNIGADFSIVTDGVQVVEYHQIKAIAGSRITLYEPLMHDVESKWSWALYTFPHYEGVGIEDLTFEGDAKDDYVHHGSWQDDGAYKPINMMRLTDSWMRRVNFLNVSEASSIINCANVSVYDIRIEGNVGHSAIRSQSSTRVFMGKIFDKTGGGAGQFHAVGVSNQSIGAVLWRNEWGTDSCFESHAKQPRATLIDCCKGGFMEYHQGGDYNQGPSHMEDLTMWNFYATTTSGTTPFKWWNASDGWRFLNPIMVGFNGASVTFDSSQLLYEESTSAAVYPESLYEAQIERRLGSLPSWLTQLKEITY